MYFGLYIMCSKVIYCYLNILSYLCKNILRNTNPEIKTLKKAKYLNEIIQIHVVLNNKYNYQFLV